MKLHVTVNMLRLSQYGLSESSTHDPTPQQYMTPYYNTSCPHSLTIHVHILTLMVCGYYAMVCIAWPHKFIWLVCNTCSIVVIASCLNSHALHHSQIVRVKVRQILVVLIHLLYVGIGKGFLNKTITHT